MEDVDAAVQRVFEDMRKTDLYKKTYEECVSVFRDSLKKYGKSRTTSWIITRGGIPEICRRIIREKTWPERAHSVLIFDLKTIVSDIQREMEEV